MWDKVVIGRGLIGGIEIGLGYVKFEMLFKNHTTADVKRRLDICVKQG